MSEVLADFRKQYPQYNDMDDQSLARALHKKHYSDVPFDQYAEKIGLKAEPKAPEVPDYQQDLMSLGDAVDSVGNASLELLSSFNRGAIGLADLPANILNYALEKAGSNQRAHTIGDTEIGQQGTTGNFMEPGLAKDVVRSAGEVVPAAVAGGAAMTGLATRLPASAAGNASRAAAQTAGARTAAAPVVAPTESTAAGVVRQIGAATPAADIGYGAASGAGAAYGREKGGDLGAVIGAVLAPLTAAGAKTLGSGALKLGKDAVQAFTRSADEIGEEAAAQQLAEAMAREGLSPDEVAKRLTDLGPEAIPADVGNSFARLLRVASNKMPRVEGEAASVLNARHQGQGARIRGAFGDSAGIVPNASVDDVITRLNTQLGPKIDELYAAARTKSEQVLGGPKPTEGYSFGGSHLQPKRSKLDQLLDGENIGGSATKQAELELKAKQLSGEPVTKLDRIDATKRALDDQIKAAIREGKMNRARSLLSLKNQLVTEADELIPEYKQARNLFAGKATLENAADLGKEFFKMKPRDIAETIKTMGQSERMMFRLGAKQALIDKLDTMQISRDAVKALFGKGGDAQKLMHVFPDRESFNKFADALEREAHFVMTRRAAQGNSTTAQQQFDGKSFEDAFEAVRAISGDPAAQINFVGKAIAKLTGDKAGEARTKALEEVGDLLLEKGMNPDKIASILRRGSAKEVSTALRRVLPDVPDTAFRTGAAGGTVESKPRTSEKWGLTIVGDPAAAN